MRTLRTFAAGLLALSLVGSGLQGCSKKRDDKDIKAEKADLPPLAFGDDTPNLMLTWIDRRGGTHVEEKPDYVPREGKKLVRVLIKGEEAGISDPIYVVDLTTPSGDGKYAARSMPRQEWDEEIERRRGARVAALPEGATDDEDPGPRRTPRTPRGPSRPPPQNPGNAPGPDPGPGEDPDPPRHPFGDSAKNLDVIVYGASWCGPCHMAMKHLDQLGVKYTFKDIDKDPGASSELHGKLSRAHMPEGSIPVIDIAGRLLIGYDAGSIDKAIEQVAGGTML
ncbi:MAG: glutaredoxin family protein [Polyangiaceae bacterium]